MRIHAALLLGLLTLSSKAVGQAAPLSAPPPAPAAESGERIHDCVRRCPDGEEKPVLLSFPNLWDLYGATYTFNERRTREFILVQFVVENDGTTRPGTLRIVSSTAPLLERAVQQGVLQARFRPATASGRSVVARAQLRVEIRPEGQILVYRVSGP